MPEVRLTATPVDAPGLIVPVLGGSVPERWARQARADGFAGEPDSMCEILGGPGRVVLVGVGEDVEAAGACAASRLLRCARVAIDARGLPAGVAARLAAGACLRAWRYTRLRTQPDDEAVLLEALDLISDDPDAAEAWARLAAGVEGALFARDLVTEPSDTLTPAGFVARLDPLARAGVGVEAIGAGELARLGCGGLLAVGRGSVHPPCLVVLRWAGTLGGAPVAFVGKGITFDTGGICIKPADGMWEMRADMAGAAACAGAMLALARRGSPAPAIAVLALAENATGADSYRPGDVLRMADGSTVQVVDTDAEGRLVLADALAWVAREAPAAVIDLATLTGSIVVALGHERAGAFGNDTALAEALVAAGHAVGEAVWPMPIDESHRRALDSDIADIRHCVDGSGQPDACQAAAFLRAFVAAGTPWAHLDIAGVEGRAEAEDRWAKGATGFGARLLDRLVADRFERHG
jgi:leucyl aminopeptidase